MIAARRALHRHVFSALLIIVPFLLAVSLLLSPEVPPKGSLNPLLLRQGGFAESEQWQPHTITAGSLTFEALIIDSAPQSVLRLRPASMILKPDILVYWAPSTHIGEGLPAGSILIGRLAGVALRDMPLPDQATEGTGLILVYSLSHNEIVAHFPLNKALPKDAWQKT